jgi:hypothetical protein
MEKKMTQMNDKTVNYQIVNKEGEVVEDLSFNDYDKLADHMMDLAQKWYDGLYDPDDTVNVSTFDNTGNLIYQDTATFKETMNGDESSLEDEIKNYAKSNNKGFGSSVKTSGKKNK